MPTVGKMISLNHWITSLPIPLSKVIYFEVNSVK